MSWYFMFGCLGSRMFSPSVKLTLFIPTYYTNYMNVIFSYVKIVSKHSHHISFSNKNLPWICIDLLTC